MLDTKEHTFNWLTNEMPGLACYVDKNLNYHFMNAKYKQLWKISNNEDIRKLNISDVLGSEYSKVKNYVQTVLSGKKVTYEVKLGIGIIQVHYIPDFEDSTDEKSEVNGFFLIGLDVTELRETQTNYQKDLIKEVEVKTQYLTNTLENLKKTQNLLIEEKKMASIGALVASVSHELNTPIGICLTGISKLLELNNDIKKSYFDGKLSQKILEVFLEDNSKLLDLIESNIQRSSDLVKSFKNISISQVNDNLIEVDIFKLITDTFNSLKPKYKGINVLFSTNLKNKLLVKIYAGLFFQVLSNLIHNSYLHGFKQQKQYSINVDIFMDEENLIIKYSDDGIGLSDEAKEHLFEPFFTTDISGIGTGLGMTVVYNIITQKLLGQIKIDKNINKGLRIDMIIPIKISEVKKND